MYCEKCGKQLPEDSLFCQYCGSKIEVIKEEKNIPIDTDCKQEISSEDVFKLMMETQIKATKEAYVANSQVQTNYENDNDFGLVPEKPIYTLALKSVDGEIEYLRRLRAIDGKPVKWARQGSMSIEGVHGMIDIYDIYLLSGEKYKTIYINMYGAHTSSSVPRGFVDSSSLINKPSISKTSKSTKNSAKTKKIVIISAIALVVIVLGIVLALPEIKYQKANNLLEENQYDAAYAAFIELENYRNSEDMLNECLYLKACSLLDRAKHEDAIELFAELDGYKNSKQKLNEAKYCYVLENRNNLDVTTFDYLKSLKNQDYKDSANIYAQLYDWKITVFAINSSETDEITNENSISKHKPVYFHMILSGGEPGASTRVTVRSTLPNGNTDEYVFENKWGDGDYLWYGWSEGIYINPTYGASGILRCDFYDDEGNLIGAGSINMVDPNPNEQQDLARAEVVDWLKDNYSTYKDNCMTYSAFSEDESTYYALEYDTLEDHLYIGSSWQFEDGDSMFLLLSLDSDNLEYNYTAVYTSGQYQNQMKGTIKSTQFTSETVLSYISYNGDYWNKEILINLYSSAYIDLIEFFDWCLSDNDIDVSIADFGFRKISFSDN